MTSRPPSRGLLAGLIEAEAPGSDAETSCFIFRSRSRFAQPGPRGPEWEALAEGMVQRPNPEVVPCDSGMMLLQYLEPSCPRVPIWFDTVEVFAGFPLHHAYLSGGTPWAPEEMPDGIESGACSSAGRVRCGLSLGRVLEVRIGRPGSARGPQSSRQDTPRNRELPGRGAQRWIPAARHR